MDRLRTQASHARDIEALDQVQLLQQDVTARVWRHLVDPMSMVVDVDGLVPAGVESSQIRFRYQAIVVLAELRHLARDVTLVKGSSSALGYLSQRRAQIPLHQNLSGRQWPAGRLEDRAGKRIGRKVLMLLRQHGCQFVTDRKAALAQINGRSENIAKTPLAESLVRQQPAVDEARNRDAEHALHGNAATLEIALPCRRCRRQTGGIDPEHLLRLGIVDHDETIPPDTGHRQLDDTEGSRRRYGGVDGIAACLHDLNAGLRRQRIP